jgi:fumarate hydratase class II
MNANEVIANRAIELAGGELGSKPGPPQRPRQPRPVVQRRPFPPRCTSPPRAHRSSHLLPRPACPARPLAEKAEAFDDIVKIGRTHLMDAVPLTLGQEFDAWVAQLDANLPNGSNRPGATSLRACHRRHRRGHRPQRPPGLRRADAAGIADHRPAVQRHPNKLRGHRRPRRHRRASGALRTIAVEPDEDRQRRPLARPRARAAGLGELKLPANEPGSSIMPGKVNPTQAEALTMVARRSWATT